MDCCGVSYSEQDDRNSLSSMHGSEMGLEWRASTKFRYQYNPTAADNVQNMCMHTLCGYELTKYEIVTQDTLVSMHFT